MAETYQMKKLFLSPIIEGEEYQANSSTTTAGGENDNQPQAKYDE